jgi:hypothetical protein
MWDSIKFWMAKSVAEMLITAAFFGALGLIVGALFLRAWWQDRQATRKPNNRAAQD